MKVFLEKIQFNHKSPSAATSALNIRRNETQTVDVPEWRRGISVKPEDSPVAYAIDETRGDILTIRAKFKCSDPKQQFFAVRALDGRISPRAASCYGWRAWAIWLLRPILRRLTGGVLGEVREQYVFLQDGASVNETLTLKDVCIWSAGVGVHDIVWRWQYRLDAYSPWVDFAESTHRIYTLFSRPKSPWLTGADADAAQSTQLPWTEVLDYACRWAADADNAGDVAACITQRVFELGPDIVQFDEVNHGSSHFIVGKRFDCTAFLRRLRGEDKEHKLVNCSDCATIVSSFANCLGCALSQSPIIPTVNDSFPLNLHKRIGRPDWVMGSFMRHEVAWEGDCKENDEVFDACLQVDGDDDPDTVTALLPTNLRFGQIGERGYRFRLAHAGQEDSCMPFPIRRRRRPIGLHARVERAEMDVELLANPARDTAAAKWAGKVLKGHLFIRGFFLNPDSLPGWHLLQLQEFEIEDAIIVNKSFWKRLAGDADVVIRVDAYEATSWEKMQESLFMLLADFQLPGIARVEGLGFGDVVFAGPEHAVILFATANLVFLLRNVGADVMPLTEVAAFVNQFSITLPQFAELKQVDPLARFRFDVMETSVGHEVRLIEEPSDLLERRRLYKFFSSAGETSRQEAQIIYRPTEPGLHTLKIYAVDAQGGALGQELQLNVRA